MWYEQEARQTSVISKLWKVKQLPFGDTIFFKIKANKEHLAFKTQKIRGFYKYNDTADLGPPKANIMYHKERANLVRFANPMDHLPE